MERGSAIRTITSQLLVWGVNVLRKAFLIVEMPLLGEK